MSTHQNQDPHRFHRMMGLIGALILISGVAGDRVPADPAIPADHPPVKATPMTLGALLPHTDGADVDTRPPEADPAERQRQLREAQRACAGPCATPFGTALGAAEGVEARSNCVSTCLRLEYSFLDHRSGQIRVARQPPANQRFEYAGITYQCVEYARRWWISQFGLTFGDVPTAADIFDLTAGIRLPGRDAVPLGRSLNGVARRPPRRGDLVVYAADPAAPDWRAGHVAVVVDVSVDQDWAALAEENYDNRPWRDPQRFARQVRLFEVGGRYTLVDVPPHAARNPEGGRIVGWVYPLDVP